MALVEIAKLIDIPGYSSVKSLSKKNKFAFLNCGYVYHFDLIDYNDSFFTIHFKEIVLDFKNNSTFFIATGGKIRILKGVDLRKNEKFVQSYVMK